MNREKCKKNIDDDIMLIIKSIEEQIMYFEENKPLFFQKKKLIKYNKRIEELELVKRYLCRRLEYIIDDN